MSQLLREHCGDQASHLPGVRLYSHDLLLKHEADRVGLSAGTALATLVDPAGPPLDLHAPADAGPPRYRDGAILPKLPWRAPNPQEAEDLWTADPAFGIGRTVAVLKLFDPNTSKAEMKPLLRTADPHSPMWPLALLKWSLDRIAQLCDIEGEPVYRGIAENPPDSMATTWNPASDEYLGLHFDDAQQAAISQLDGALNRVSINIGPVDRLLMFVNLTPAEMLQVLRREETRVDTFTPGLTDTIGYEFMRRYPSYPAMRLRIRPGEAYVAPTDSILHDASSLGIKENGRQLVFLGRFHCKA